MTPRAPPPDPMLMPAHDEDAEGQLISSFFIDKSGNDILRQIQGYVSPNDFYLTPYRLIYEAAISVDGKGEKIDVVTLTNELNETDKLKRVGGPEKLSAIMSDAISFNPVGHAKIIRACALKRRLYHLGVQLSRGAGTGKSVSELMEHITTEIEEIQVYDNSFRGTDAFSFVRLSEIDFRDPDWLVKGIMEKDTISLIFSDPGSGKTFLAVDLTCCIATGALFHGHPVAQGPVIFIAGEGQNGIRRRFGAWEIRHKYSLENAPIFLSKTPACFCDEAGARKVQAAIKASGITPSAVVVDTVARNFGPGNENDTKDMTAFVNGLDLIRTKYQCAVILIHHTGHGDKSRGRGAMALKGALDAEYRLEKDDLGTVRVTNTKMKDFEPPAPMAFKIRSVDLGLVDEEGKLITSAVLDSIDYEPPVVKKAVKQGKWQTLCHGILMDLMEKYRRNLEKNGYDPNGAKVAIKEVKDEAVKQGLSPKHWSRYFKYLSGLDSVVVNKPYFETPPHFTPNNPNGEK